MDKPWNCSLVALASTSSPHGEGNQPWIDLQLSSHLLWHSLQGIQQMPCSQHWSIAFLDHFSSSLVWHLRLDLQLLAGVGWRIEKLYKEYKLIRTEIIDKLIFANWNRQLHNLFRDYFNFWFNWCFEITNASSSSLLPPSPSIHLSLQMIKSKKEYNHIKHVQISWLLYKFYIVHNQNFCSNTTIS